MSNQSWFIEAASNSHTGKLSSHRVLALVAGFTLSGCTLFLSVASFFEPQLITPLTLFGTTLGGMAGAGYVTNKITNKSSGDS